MRIDKGSADGVDAWGQEQPQQFSLNKKIDDPYAAKCYKVKTLLTLVGNLNVTKSYKANC